MCFSVRRLTSGPQFLLRVSKTPLKTSLHVFSSFVSVPKPFAKLNRFEEAMLERLEEEAEMPAELEAAINHRLSVGISAEEVL